MIATYSDKDNDAGRYEFTIKVSFGDQHR